MRTIDTYLRILIITIMALAYSVAGISPVSAQVVDSATYKFTTCSGNLPADVATGEAQLTVVVSLLLNGNILFTFENSGPNPSSITDVYFYDPFDHLVTPMAIDGSEGVLFSEDADPPDLPSGNTCPGLSGDGTLVFTSHDSADSDPPAQPNGVNPGEWLTIEMELSTWVTFNDILAGLSSGQIRIGIHVQGFEGDGSETFVNLGEPTYVQLASFEVEEVDGGVAVRWETAAEIDNVGFNVYRAASPAGPFTKVNSLLIPAQGNGTGAAYELVDPNGGIGDVYRLEDLDYNGTRTMHLPVEVEAVLDNFVFLPIVQSTVVVR